MLLLLLLALVALAAPSSEIRVLDLKGGVDAGSADYLVRGMTDAEDEHAHAVVIRMDTPGGLLDATREIVRHELISGIPVIVYVEPSGARAGSAGVFITMAANIAAMAPGTTIGAAHPVDLFGGGGTGEPAEGEGAEGQPEGAKGGARAMDEKIENDAAAWARAIAEQRGRNVEWAEQAVRKSVAITDREAVAIGVVDLAATDLADLLDQVDGRTVTTAEGPKTLATANATVTVVPMTLRQKVVHFLGDPNVLFALLALGLLGLYTEFQHPGLVAPGVLGATMLLAAAVGLSLLPFNIGGLLLVLIGFAMFGLEVWVGAKGLFALGGTAAVILGGILLFEVEGFDLTVDTATLVTVGALSLSITLLVAWLVARAHGRPVKTGSEALVGAVGNVLVGGDGAGRVDIVGEDWRATWKGVMEAGTRVRVVQVDGLNLVVEPEARS